MHTNALRRSPPSTRDSGPCQPREIRLPLVDRIPRIVAACAGRHVLHLGCMAAPHTAAAIASGSHLHVLLCHVSAALLGLDVDLTARHLLPPDSAHHAIVQADVTVESELARAVHGRVCDRIVAGELLEHLANPGLCLSALACLRPDALLIVSVPNCLSAAVAARAAIGVETVHHDHVAWYSPRTLRRLLEMTGWPHVDLYAAGTDPATYQPDNLRCPVLLAECRTH